MLRFSMQPLESRMLLNAGQLDPTFDVAGVQHLDATGKGESFSDAQLAPDGKIVVAVQEASRPVIYRFDADGETPDETFGRHGVVVLPATYNFAQEIAVQNDGRILLFLADNSVVRLQTDGSIDTSFGGIANGNPTGTPAGEIKPTLTQLSDDPLQMAVAPDGRIALTSNAMDSYGVFMFTADGAPDTSFNHTGQLEVTTANSVNTTHVASIAFQSDGTLVALANELFFSEDQDDPGSGASVDLIDRAGHFTDVSIGLSNAQLVAIAPQDQILVLSLNSNGVVNTAQISRFFADGQPDASFVNSVVGISTAADTTTTANLIALPDGGVLLGGTALPDSSGEFALARYTPQGASDPTFGSNGITLLPQLPFNQTSFSKLAILPQTDGRLLLAAATPTASLDSGFTTLTRLQGDPTIRLNSAGKLIVGGTTGDDVIRIYRRSRDGAIVARVNDAARSFKASRVHKIAVFAQAGNDEITIGNGVRAAYIDGGDGNDTLNGGSGNDILLGGAGKDRIYGNDGDDTLVGGSSNDYLLGGAGKDDLFGSNGNDTLIGAGGSDRLFGQAGADHLSGGAGTDESDTDPTDTRDMIETLI